MTEVTSHELGGEDAKLVTLAKGARARVSAEEGAAVRDETGRTYSAANVTLPALSLTAIELAIASALSAGARGMECVVAVRDSDELSAGERQLISDVGGCVVILCNADGSLRIRHSVSATR